MGDLHESKPEDSARGVAGRLAIESLVIIVSILAAFAMDTWWDEVQGRREERATLEALHAEFTAARETLSRYRGHQRRILVSVASVSDSLDAAFRRGQRTVVVSDTALGLAYITPTTAVTLGALEGLLASGRLGIVEDRELRDALGSWGSELAELTEEEIDSRALAFGDFDRTLRARVNTHGLWATANGLFQADPEALEPRSTRTIPADTEMIGVFHLRRSLLRHAIGEFEPLIAEIDRILALIERSQ
jgi:hypothetical protein